MSYKQILVIFLVSALTSISVLLTGLLIYHFQFAVPLFIKPEPMFTPKEKNLVRANMADDRIGYACSGETQRCEDGFKQQCIYVTCACQDGFKPKGEVDGCVKITVDKPLIKKVDEDIAFTEQGWQYAFAGECNQICRQVGH